jgi:hypothetical protein
MEPDLFSSDATVHDLILAKGKGGAKELVVHTTREPGRNAPIDILTGRRGPRIIDAAANHMGDETLPDRAVRSHVYSAWCHAGMPHKRPREDATNWRIETDYVTLLLEPGTRVEAN